MALDADSIFNAVESHAMSLGLFEVVNGHAPKSPPNSGLGFSVTVEAVDPIPSSGLAVTSVRLGLDVRLYRSFMSQPADAIDPNLLSAMSVLFTEYIGNFTLGGLIREVDVLGSHGPGLSVRAGYIDQGGQDNRAFRITLPLIVNDVWTEAP